MCTNGQPDKSDGVFAPYNWIGLGALFAVEIPLLPQVSEGNVAWVNQWLAALGEQIGFLYQPEPEVEF